MRGSRRTPVTGPAAAAAGPDRPGRSREATAGDHHGRLHALAPRRPREHEATRLLLTAAMQATRRAAGLSAGDLITAGGSC
jgi:hypothetical protein